MDVSHAVHICRADELQSPPFNIKVVFHKKQFGISLQHRFSSFLFTAVNTCSEFTLAPRTTCSPSYGPPRQSLCALWRCSRRP